MNEGGASEEQLHRIICRADQNYCLAIRGGLLVFALINPCDRYQHWIKDEWQGSDGSPIKDSEGQPAFALVNRATGEAIGHCGKSMPVPLKRYDVESGDKSVLWTMSKNAYEGFRYIRRVDQLTFTFTATSLKVHDGHIIDLYDPRNADPRNGPEDAGFHWKIMKVVPSACISLFRPSQHTVKISCQAKEGYNLTIHKDGCTVLLVRSDPKDKYQHWIKETVNSMPVRDELNNDAFALVNKATGKAIKHGFGSCYLVQLAPFNRSYIDASLLWTRSNNINGRGFGHITMQNNRDLAFDVFDTSSVDCPLLGLSETGSDATQLWKIEDFVHETV